MVIDRVVVSRKTPMDGRLEVSEPAAEVLRRLPGGFTVVVRGRVDRGRVEAMACTCRRAASAGHTHHFVVAPVLKNLPPELHVLLRLDAAAASLFVVES